MSEVKEPIDITETVMQIKNLKLPEGKKQLCKIFHRIKEERKKKNMTVTELSNLSGVGEEEIRRMEGYIAEPQLIDVINVCTALELKVTAN